MKEIELDKEKEEKEFLKLKVFKCYLSSSKC